MAFGKAMQRLNGLKEDKYYQKLFANEHRGKSLAADKLYFIDSLNELFALDPTPPKIPDKVADLPNLVDLLKIFNILKPGIEPEFKFLFNPPIELPGLNGIRFYILGPPYDFKSIQRRDGPEGSTFKKRPAASSVNMAFLNAVLKEPGENNTMNLFDRDYELSPVKSKKLSNFLEKEEWRNIKYDWLFQAGSLALDLPSGTNNTSLAIAIQFKKSGRVLLFPGDAEFGNWSTWNGNNMEWTIKQGATTQKITVDDLLEKTVFYKVSHHLSHNGTGIEILNKMQHSDLVAMATLDLKKILPGWRSTMPNDLLSAELIRKTQGRLFLLGDTEIIVKNMLTDRVDISTGYLDKLRKLNKPNGHPEYYECEITG
ncbi:MAG: hypothetical protein ACKVU0_20625 [Saprospiraceae bacterium]